MHPADAAFLRAIREQPDDDLPRLIYADYLDERGDPRGERRMVRETRVARDDLRGLCSGVGNQLLVTPQREEPQRRPATGLRGAEHVTLPSLLDVEAGQFESVGGQGHVIQSLASWAPAHRVGDQQAGPCGLAPANAAAQLMQLRHAETVGIEHRHNRGVRDVHADLDHGCRYEHVDVARNERAHHLVALVAGEPAVHGGQSETRQRAVRKHGQDVYHSYGRPLVPELLVARFVVEVAVRLSAITADSWAHDERLSAGGHFFANPSPRAGEPGRLLAGRHNRRGDRRPACGQLGQHGRFQVTEHRHRDCPRDRCRGHDEQVWWPRRLAA